MRQVHMTERPDPPEEACAIACEGDRLWGIVARPPEGVPLRSTAVLVGVGGPQYRAGSHRQFVRLARRLACAGYASLRFDARGMGDSEGTLRSFESMEADYAAALDALARACPQAPRLVVFGLCDAASAALMFAAPDPRVAGLVTVNPWARSAATLAGVQVRHYYLARLAQREFWRKLLGGGLNWKRSLGSFVADLARARARPTTADGTFQARMARGLAAFRGRVLLVLSGKDLTAQEFLHYAATAPAWQGLLADPKVQRIDLPEADHTFSRRGWFTQVENEVLAWLDDLDAGDWRRLPEYAGQQTPSEET